MYVLFLITVIIKYILQNEDGNLSIYLLLVLLLYIFDILFLLKVFVLFSNLTLLFKDVLIFESIILLDFLK